MVNVSFILSVLRYFYRIPFVSHVFVIFLFFALIFRLIGRRTV